MRVRKKISVIGAGGVGSQAAFLGTLRKLGDFVLVDIVEGLPQGKALDILEAAPVLGVDSRASGTNSYEGTKDSDIVVITAGFPRKPGISREELVKVNKGIVEGVVKEAVKYSPNCVLIIVTNPLDAMAYLAKKVSGFPRERVVGMAGVLDSSRFRAFAGQELGVSARKVEAMVLGGHGDEMVPLSRLGKVKGKPLRGLLSEEEIKKIEERTRGAGGEIINLLKNGSTTFAPAAAIVEMIEVIAKDKKRILPCSVYLEGEYGFRDIFLGVPVRLGAGGAEEIVVLELDEEEKKSLEKTAEKVKETIGMLELPAGN